MPSPDQCQRWSFQAMDPSQPKGPALSLRSTFHHQHCEQPYDGLISASCSHAQEWPRDKTTGVQSHTSHRVPLGSHSTVPHCCLLEAVRAHTVLVTLRERQIFPGTIWVPSMSHQSCWAEVSTNHSGQGGSDEGRAKI